MGLSVELELQGPEFKVQSFVLNGFKKEGTDTGILNRSTKASRTGEASTHL